MLTSPSNFPSAAEASIISRLLLRPSNPGRAGFEAALFQDLITKPALVHRHAELVADICPANPEDDIGGNVGRMIGYALEAARDHQAVHRLLCELRPFLDELEQIGMGAAIHAVDLVIHFAHG